MDLPTNFNHQVFHHDDDLFDIVHFNFFQITEHGLKSIAKNCKQLRRLSVSRCYGVTDKAVTALVQGCPLLTELDVGWCYKVTDHSLRLIPVHCSHFESIRIKGCNVSDHTLRALYAAGISVNNFFWVLDTLKVTAKPYHFQFCNTWKTCVYNNCSMSSFQNNNFGTGIGPYCVIARWRGGCLLSPRLQTLLGCMDWQLDRNSARTSCSTWVSLVRYDAAVSEFVL